jgi:Protein of unknown function (DUF3341)
MYLMSEFSDKLTLSTAVQSLKSKGIGMDELAIFSTEPVDLEHGVLDRPSHMTRNAIAGAITVGGLSALFVWFAQHNYEIITGGMPYFTPWATGVVHFELTMLGAVAATFLTFLWESGILRRDRHAPVPNLVSRNIYLRVHCEPGQVLPAGECLYQSGASKVEKLEAHG